MKKPLAAMFLALALCLGLAIPALAADPAGAQPAVPEGSYTVDLDKPDSAEMGVDGQFTVRYLTSGRSYEEAKPRVDVTRTLPQGSQFTWSGLRPSHSVFFRFFTDLDQDGTYDERLVVKQSGKNVLAPYEEKYASALTLVSGKSQPASVFASMVEEMGGQLTKDESGVMTLAISSDSLCQFFGGSTLFEWGVMKNGASVVIKGTMLFTAGEQTGEPAPGESDTPEETDPVPEDSDKPEETDPAAPAFTDVAEGAYYAAPVAWALAHEPAITNGTSETTFEPDKTCSEAEILTFLYRAAGEPQQEAKTPMANVKEGDFFYNAAQWASGLGAVEPDAFDPNEPCTRAQAVKFIWTAFGQPEAEKSAFTDVPEDADYAPAVDWALENEITNGDGGDTVFNPGGTCTRGQIVALLYRAYNAK